MENVKPPFVGRLELYERIWIWWSNWCPLDDDSVSIHVNSSICKSFLTRNPYFCSSSRNSKRNFSPLKSRWPGVVLDRTSLILRTAGFGRMVTSWSCFLIKSSENIIQRTSKNPIFFYDLLYIWVGLLWFVDFVFPPFFGMNVKQLTFIFLQVVKQTINQNKNTVEICRGFLLGMMQTRLPSGRLPFTVSAVEDFCAARANQRSQASSEVPWRFSLAPLSSPDISTQARQSALYVASFALLSHYGAEEKGWVKKGCKPIKWYWSVLGCVLPFCFQHESIE